MKEARRATVAEGHTPSWYEWYMEWLKWVVGRSSQPLSMVHMLRGMRCICYEGCGAVHILRGMCICYKGCYKGCGAVHIHKGCAYATRDVHMLRGMLRGMRGDAYSKRDAHSPSLSCTCCALE